MTGTKSMATGIWRWDIARTGLDRRAPLRGETTA